MKRLIALSLVCSACVAPAFAQETEEEYLPRDPFWPQDYEGTRQPITLNPRIKPQPKEDPAPRKGAKAKAKKPTLRQQENAKAEAERRAAEAARAAEEKLWIDARKALDFGSSFNFSSSKRSGASVTINGRAYGVGDLVSMNVGERRFTWSVAAISPDGKITLTRQYYKHLNNQKNGVK